MRPAHILLAACYIIVGLGFGAAVRVSIPAVNLAGGLYMAATWPAWFKGSPIKLTVPAWAFSFEPRQP